MLKEPYTAKSYSYHSKYIKNALALRPPQADSLEIFARLCDVLSLKKDADLDQELAAVRALCPTLTSFERDFPSICFSLATGIGKTRLMGACIAYLHYEKDIHNFFVMAPNLTIYKKLKTDPKRILSLTLLLPPKRICPCCPRPGERRSLYGSRI